MIITKNIVNTPSEIYSLQLGVPHEYRDELVKETYRLKNRKNRDNEDIFKHLFKETNDQVIGSSSQVWKESQSYNLLLKNILKISSSFFPPNHEYRIYDAWVGTYKKDQLSIPHSHEPAYRSFCYYIKSTEPYTPMVFNDAGIEIEAITDRLIIFPSSIKHSVPPSLGGERIIIAGNIVSIMHEGTFTPN